MDIAAQMRELARNLYWTWQPDVVEVFRDLDLALWRQVNHNPVALLDQLPQGALEEQAGDLALHARVNHAFHRLRDYLGAEDTWGAHHAGVLHAQPVAYFSAEFGLHESLPLYSGGLGVLAGDHLKGASDLGVPLVGVGLFYAQGYFNQRLDENGWQREEYFAADVNTLPLEVACDRDGRPLQVAVQTDRSEIRIRIWTARVGRCRLVLLDTNVPDNTPEDRTLTAQLYGGDRRVRINQELVLGVGGLRALEALGIDPGVIHLNEGHSAFAILELARRQMQRDGRAFAEVRGRVAQMTVFTTHTPVPAGHDRFDPQLVEQTLRPLYQQLNISSGELLALGRTNPDNDGEPFNMTVLGLRMSRYRNGVSALHGRVSRAMCRDLWPGRGDDAIPIGHITNGVHMSSWLAAPMAQLYSRHLGADWHQRKEQARMWARVTQIDRVEFWEQHQILKTRLVSYVRRRTDPGGAAPREARFLDPSILTIGFARRFTSYKRGDLLFHDLDRLDRLVNHPTTPVQIVCAGKAHPADESGKRIIQQIVGVTRDPRFAGRVLFVEDHDYNVGRHFVQGVDLWLNTPRRPLEACGTSGQKAVLNGALNLSTLDGWWAQAYDGRNGFAIGNGAEHTDAGHQDKLDGQALFEVLEQEVLPLYYDRDAAGVPHGWIRRQQHAVRTLAWRFSARRMLADYTMKCYLPAVGGLTASVGVMD